jgi:hypothetical protein
LTRENHRTGYSGFIPAGSIDQTECPRPWNPVSLDEAEQGLQLSCVVAFSDGNRIPLFLKMLQMLRISRIAWDL